MNTHPLPLTFRQREIEQILSAVQAGDSCAVVGIGSVGKSNLMRFLQRTDVQQKYLEQDAGQMLFIYVDMNKLLKKSLWGLLELMLHQLLVELANQRVDERQLKEIEALHQKATQPKTRSLALRYLDRALRLVFVELKYRLVFLFDEFDELCRSLSPRAFAALRAMRDDYKYQLMYVVTTRLEMKRLREEIVEIEPFEEIITSRTIWLGPYSADDARFMLKRLEGRYDTTVDNEMAQRILATSGGHPGLLREAFHQVISSPDNAAPTLTPTTQIESECQRIWLSLTSDEQQLMTDLAGGHQPQTRQQSVLDRLRRKGLVGGPWAGQTDLFSTLFAGYVEQAHPAVGSTIFVDANRRSVWLNGHEITGLTHLEFSLIQYLFQKHGQVCTWDELADHLYPEDMGAVTDTRLASVVKRLRKKVEPHPKGPKYIITERGHGVRLVT